MCRRYDYVEIHDGNSESADLLGKHCSNIAPPPIISSGPALHIKFVSDYAHQGAGFSLRYEIFKTGKFSLTLLFFLIYIYKENKDPLILNSLYSVVESWADVVSTFVLLCGVCMLYLSQAAPVSSSSPKTWWHGLVLMESLQVHPIPQCIGATWGSVF